MMKFAIYSAITDNGRIDNNSINNYYLLAYFFI